MLNSKLLRRQAQLNLAAAVGHCGWAMVVSAAQDSNRCEGQLESEQFGSISVSRSTKP